MSFPLRFLLGSQLYASLGGEDSAGKTASGVALAVAGTNPVGIVLTRQLALSRLPDVPTGQPSPTPGTRAPIADFSHTADGLTVKFTDKSTGTIASRTWHFHDIGMSSEKDPHFTFDGPGRYKIVLMVVGENGVSNATARDIELSATTPAPSPVPQGPTPVAGFDVTVDGLKASFTDKSIGTIATREWRFGDDQTSSELHPSHAYTKAGQYPVELAVTDQKGVRNSTERQLTVSDGTTGTTPGQPAPAVPVADFGSAVTGLGVKFTDKSLGTAIQSRRWDFGEAGATSTEKDPTHSYQKGSTYKVTLTVTDDKGVSNATTREIAVKK